MSRTAACREVVCRTKHCAACALLLRRWPVHGHDPASIRDERMGHGKRADVRQQGGPGTAEGSIRVITFRTLSLPCAAHIKAPDHRPSHDLRRSCTSRDGAIRRRDARSAVHRLCGELRTRTRIAGAFCSVPCTPASPSLAPAYHTC